MYDMVISWVLGGFRGSAVVRLCTACSCRGLCTGSS